MIKQLIILFSWILCLCLNLVIAFKIDSTETSLLTLSNQLLFWISLLGTFLYGIYVLFLISDHITRDIYVRKIINQCEKYKIEHESEIIMAKILGELVIVEVPLPFNSLDHCGIESEIQCMRYIITNLEDKGYRILYSWLNDKIIFYI